MSFIKDYGITLHATIMLSEFHLLDIFMMLFFET